MRIFGMVAAVACIGLAACNDAEAPTATQAVALADPVPDAMHQETFAGCQWGKVTGSGLSVWSYDCPVARGDVRLVADDNLPGFAIEGVSDGVTSRSPAIVIFKKAAEAPTESILAAVRARSPGPHSATCTLQPIVAEGVPPGAFTFAPVGDVATQWAAFSNGDAGAVEMEAPCGDMGPQMVGDRSFQPVSGDPTTVVFVEYGSEIQIFDAATIRPAG